MSSAREDVQGASLKLISAQHKIGDLEADLRIANDLLANEEARRQAQEEIVGRLSNTHIKLENQIHELKTSLEYFQGTYEALRVNNLELAKENEALKKGIERLKNKPENFTFDSLMEAYKVVKKQYRELKDNATFERDSILSQIRQVLGAKSDPHQTALNRAQEVMEELTTSRQLLAEKRKALQSVINENSLLGYQLKQEQSLHTLMKKDWDLLRLANEDLGKFRSNTLYCLQIEDKNIDTDKAINELKRQLINFQYKNAYDKLRKAINDQANIAGASDNDLIQFLEKKLIPGGRVVVPVEEYNKLEEMTVIARQACGLREDASVNAILGDLKVRALKKQAAEKHGHAWGGRTYTPPEGHILVEQKHYDALVKDQYHGENKVVHRDFYAKLVKDSETLGYIIRSKLS